MARKGKYTPETVEKILDAIRATGSDKAGWQAGAISERTFYEWCKVHAQFSQDVTRARETFRHVCPESLKLKALENLREYLFNGASITTTSREIIKAPDGTVLRVVEKVSKSQHPMPHWVADRILGKKLEVLEAMQVLLAEGVATPAQVDIVKSTLDLLTERLKENGQS